MEIKVFLILFTFLFSCSYAEEDIFRGNHLEFWDSYMKIELARFKECRLELKDGALETYRVLLTTEHSANTCVIINVYKDKATTTIKRVGGSYAIIDQLYVSSTKEMNKDDLQWFYSQREKLNVKNASFLGRVYHCDGNCYLYEEIKNGKYRICFRPGARILTLDWELFVHKLSVIAGLYEVRNDPVWLEPVKRMVWIQEELDKDGGDRESYVKSGKISPFELYTIGGMYFDYGWWTNESSYKTVLNFIKSKKVVNIPGLNEYWGMEEFISNKDDYDKIVSLIKAGISFKDHTENIEASSFPLLFSSVNYYSQYGTELLETLIDHGCNVNRKSEDRTILMDMPENQYSEKAIDILFKSGINLYESDSMGMICLHHQVRIGYQKNVKKLVSIEPRLLAVKDKTGMRPVLYASKEMRQFLFSLGDEIKDEEIPFFLLWNNETDKLLELLPKIKNINHMLKGGTLLTHAVKVGNKAVIKSLLTNPKIDVNLYYKQRVNNCYHWFQDSSDVLSLTPLMVAVDDNRLEVLTILLKAGADAKVVNDKGENALAIFFKNNGKDQNIEILKLLLENGADPNQVNYRGTTPFQSCFKYEFVELMLKYGADLKFKDSHGLNYSTLFINNYTFAVFENGLKVIPLLQKYGFDINSEGSDGNSLLLRALTEKNYSRYPEFRDNAERAIPILKSMGAELTPTQRLKWAAISDAEFAKYEDALKSGADINCCWFDYNNGMYNTFTGHLINICSDETVLKKVLDLTLSNNKFNPEQPEFTFGFSKGYTDPVKKSKIRSRSIVFYMIKSLLEKGVPPNSERNFFHQVPLIAFLSCPEPDIEIIELFLKRGAKVDVRYADLWDYMGNCQTAIEYAKEEHPDNKALIQLLEKYRGN